MTFLIVVALILAVALFFGFRYDRRHRSVGGSGDGTTARDLRLKGREKGSEWGAGGG